MLTINSTCTMVGEQRNDLKEAIHLHYNGALSEFLIAATMQNAYRWRSYVCNIILFDLI